jgi:hypothetical protein
MRWLAVAATVALPAAGCGGGTKRQSTLPATALLTAVRAGGNHVAFDFRSVPQRIETRFARPSQVAEAGSGRPVKVNAPVVLLVHFIPAATAVATGSSVTFTYTGPRRFRGTGSVREVVKFSDFEADLGWAIGLDRRLPVHVSRKGSTVTVSFGWR